MGIAYGKMSVAKPRQYQTNEDACMAAEGRIAVADGAGGGGVYADLWAAYLLERLPAEPITAFGGLVAWKDAVWEPFYDEREEAARRRGGLVLRKFYAEGSFATLAAAWSADGGRWRWMAYGDSVVFHYSRRQGVLSHSFTRLADFNKAPYLVSLVDPLVEGAFRSGTFDAEEGDTVFCASDALSHYILMEYELSRPGEYAGELAEAAGAPTRNAAMVRAAAGGKAADFGRDVVEKLWNCRNHNANFLRHAESLLSRHVIGLDDYSCAMARIMRGKRNKEKERKL